MARARPGLARRACAKPMCMLWLLSIVVLWHAWPTMWSSPPQLPSVDNASKELQAESKFASNMLPSVDKASKGLQAESKFASNMRQKRIVVQSMGGGMSKWPIALKQLQYFADATHHVITIPCVNKKRSKVTDCTKSYATSLTDLFDLSGWNLVPFDPEVDARPDIIFKMGNTSTSNCGRAPAQGLTQGPTTLKDWKSAASRTAVVGICGLSRDYIQHKLPLQYRSSTSKTLSPTEKNFFNSYIAHMFQWPQFNFSKSREREAENILSANGLQPAGDGHEGNYVVYHWRSEAVENKLNNIFCAEQLLSHAKGRWGSSHKRLVLVSDIPFNTSLVASLWVSDEMKRASNPTRTIVRDMLLSSGFAKLETLAPQAGVDLRQVPMSDLSVWDAILARGGAASTYCMTTACRKCNRVSSGFMIMLIHHYMQKHGPDSDVTVTSSWMQHDPHARSTTPEGLRAFLSKSND